MTSFTTSRKSGSFKSSPSLVVYVSNSKIPPHLYRGKTLLFRYRGKHIINMPKHWFSYILARIRRLGWSPKRKIVWPKISVQMIA